MCHKSVSDVVIEEPTKKVEDEFACNQCSYKAIHNKDLNRHELQMHGQALPSEVYACHECDYSTQYNDRLRRHAQIMHAKQQSRMFYSSSNRRDCHANNTGSRKIDIGKSTSEDPLQCNSCNFKTTVIEELRIHKQQHEKENVKSKLPFPNLNKFSSFSKPEIRRNNESSLRCDECKHNLHHKDEFKLHMEFFHAKTKPVNQQ